MAGLSLALALAGPLCTLATRLVPLNVRFLAWDAGQAANVPLPSLNVYRDALLGALAAGEGDLDWSVMARVRARASGLD